MQAVKAPELREGREKQHMEPIRYATVHGTCTQKEIAER